jgi:hypothetical protein
LVEEYKVDVRLLAPWSATHGGAPDAGQVITGGNDKHISEAAVGEPATAQSVAKSPNAVKSLSPLMTGIFADTLDTTRQPLWSSA